MLRIERLRSRAIYGTSTVVADKLRALAAERGVAEIAILTTLHDPQARRHSYTLLAEEFAK
jgi:alkanesulfonate monooxygenase SsuD/methylene tetrahydromethanopterin reductase-like flavin-dependent oxidoreductase (luciferase family)